MKTLKFSISLVVATLISTAVVQATENIVSPGRQLEERTSLLKRIEASKNTERIPALLNAFKSLDEAVRNGASDDYVLKEVRRLNSIADGRDAVSFNVFALGVMRKIDSKVPKSASLVDSKTWFILDTNGSVSKITSLSPPKTPIEKQNQTAIQTAIKNCAPFSDFPRDVTTPVTMTFSYSKGKANLGYLEGTLLSNPPTPEHLAKEKILSHCNSLILKRNAKEALPELNEFIKSNPKNAEGYYTRATAYVSLKDNTHAIADFSKAIELDPKDKWNYCDLAKLHNQMKHADLAIQVLTKGIASANDPTDLCLTRRARIYAEQDKISEALADCDKRLKKIEEKLAQDQKANSPESAVKKARSSMGHAYFERALVFDKAHRYDEGIKDWGKVLEFADGNEGCVFNNRGLAEKYIGRFDDALNDMNAACRHAPFHADHFVSRANLNKLLGKNETLDFDYKEGLRLADEKIAKDKSTDDIAARDYTSRGAAYVGLSQFDKAIADSRTALEMEPDDSEAYLIIGDASAGLEKYPEAIEAYTKSSQLDPKDPLPFVGRAKVHLKMGVKEKADADLQTGAKLGYIEPAKSEKNDTAGSAN